MNRRMPLKHSIPVIDRMSALLGRKLLSLGCRPLDAATRGAV